MTTQDVVQRDDRAPLALVPTPSEAVHAALEQWVGGMAASVRGAEFIVDTPMCPDAFWPLPANVSSCKTPKQPIGNEDRDSYLARRQVATYTLGAVVRYGLQLGLPPEVAVQGIFTVGGRMSMYAEQMVALIKSQGHGHRVVEYTRERCTVEVSRRGSDEWTPFTFTFEDAVLAGYVPDQGPNVGPHGKWPNGDLKKSPGNAKYLTNPAAMLYARASSIACRITFPDVLRGLTSYEDLQDEQSSVPVTVTVDEPAPARATAAALLARAADSPSALVTAGLVREAQASTRLDGETHSLDEAAPAVPPEPPVQQYVMPVSKGTLDAIRDRFIEIGLGGARPSAAERAQRIRVVNAIIPRLTPVEESRDLTREEGNLVADNLAGDAGRRLCAEVLDRPDLAPADEPTDRELDPAAAAEADASVEAEGKYYDPTAEPGWPGGQS